MRRAICYDNTLSVWHGCGLLGPWLETEQRAGGGICVDQRTDATNCGSCGHACSAGQYCSTGACLSS
ncbi:MAG: hypothetical protein JW940_18985 [Polyangiaceae bacterium]|nr:hypothetical protein [Polyangiaceae bacterium]